MTIRELTEAFIKESDVNTGITSSIKTTGIHLRYRTFLQAFGDEDVGTVTQEQISSWLKPQASSNHRKQLLELFRWAIERGLMTSNPAHTPKEVLPKTGFLTTKTIDA
jgi:hypothetical protein